MHSFESHVAMSALAADNQPRGTDLFENALRTSSPLDAGKFAWDLELRTSKIHTFLMHNFNIKLAGHAAPH